jgi:DNA repair protein RecO (recombination protein O)
MLQKTEGIVIHTLQYSDTSIIAKIFTADYGLLSFMIKGTRGKRSPNKAVLFQPLTLLALDIYHQENKNLQTIKETRLIFNPVGIYGNMHKTSVVLFMAEVLQKLLKEHDVNAGLFTLLKQKIELLNDQSFHADFHLQWLLDITSELGFNPFNNYSATENVFSIAEGKFVVDTLDHSGPYYMNVADSKHFYQLLSGASMDMGREERRSLLAGILKYYQFHNPGMSAIRSAAVLQEVL